MSPIVRVLAASSTTGGFPNSPGTEKLTEFASAPSPSLAEGINPYSCMLARNRLATTEGRYGTKNVLDIASITSVLTTAVEGAGVDFPEGGVMMWAFVCIK